MTKSLQHVGILGMHWGHHTSEDGISNSTRNLAKKDAQRFIDAKMFYGKTAGTKRKLLKAELEKKMKDVPGYEKEFNSHLGVVDKAKSAKKAVRDRNRIDTVNKGRSLAKGILGITGSLAVGVATLAYSANKTKVDKFVVKGLKKLAGEVNISFMRF